MDNLEQPGPGRAPQEGTRNIGNRELGNSFGVWVQGKGGLGGAVLVCGHGDMQDSANTDP